MRKSNRISLSLWKKYLKEFSNQYFPTMNISLYHYLYKTNIDGFKKKFDPELNILINDLNLNYPKSVITKKDCNSFFYFYIRHLIDEIINSINTDIIKNMHKYNRAFVNEN